MTWTRQGPSAISWLRRYLDDGGLLAHYLMAMLTDSVTVSALVPDGFDGRLDTDFSVGRRHLDRQAILATVRGVFENHLMLSSRSCVLVEDLWAEKEYPCGQRSLPWITVASNRHEELYWIGIVGACHAVQMPP